MFKSGLANNQLKSTFRYPGQQIGRHIGFLHHLEERKSLYSDGLIPVEGEITMEVMLRNA